MKPIDPNDRRIANIREATFTPFVYPDGAALGDAILQLDDTRELGVGFHVYRMPAGMTTRGHRHNGHEQFLILEGELHESDGTVFRAGDLVFYRDGTEHHSYTPNGCLLAVHIAGPEIAVE
jgi:anti-sigma factor ChrR (cupin superfamily)